MHHLYGSFTDVLLRLYYGADLRGGMSLPHTVTVMVLLSILTIIVDCPLRALNHEIACIDDSRRRYRMFFSTDLRGIGVH
jgi:hypothetical protein